MNLGNVSESDMTRMHSINNPPEHVGGFGSESSSNSGKTAVFKYTVPKDKGMIETIAEQYGI